MLYKKEGDGIIEYMIIPAEERVVRRFTQEEFNKMIADTDTQIKSFDKVKYGTVAYDKAVDKLAELQEAKTELIK